MRESERGRERERERERKRERERRRRRRRSQIGYSLHSSILTIFTFIDVVLTVDSGVANATSADITLRCFSFKAALPTILAWRR